MRQARYHNLQRCLTSAHRRRVSPLALFHQRPCSSYRNAAAQCFRPRPCSGLPHRHHALRPSLSQIARRGCSRSARSRATSLPTTPSRGGPSHCPSSRPKPSTLTIISIPGVAFAGDFGFLQVVIGYMLGRIVVAALFLPRYFAGEMLTAYQLIDRRFGGTLHKVTAGTLPRHARRRRRCSRLRRLHRCRHRHRYARCSLHRASSPH